MGCSFSGLNGIYNAANGSGDVWINENRYRILRKLSEGDLSSIYLVKEVVPEANLSHGGLPAKKSIDPPHISDDGTYALKNVLIQSSEKLELVREEIRVSSLFGHPNYFHFLTMQSLILRLHKVNPRTMKHTCSFQFIWKLCAG